MNSIAPELTYYINLHHNYWRDHFVCVCVSCSFGRCFISSNSGFCSYHSHWTIPFSCLQSKHALQEHACALTTLTLKEHNLYQWSNSFNDLTISWVVWYRNAIAEHLIAAASTRSRKIVFSNETVSWMKSRNLCWSSTKSMCNCHQVVLVNVPYYPNLYWR